MNNIQPFNPDTKFVRIIKTLPSGFVEFEFAVGEPELFVEMLLPPMAFNEFCIAHQVIPTVGSLGSLGSLKNDEKDDAQAWEWNLRAAREQHWR